MPRTTHDEELDMTTNGSTVAYRWGIGLVLGVLLTVTGFLVGTLRADAGMNQYKKQVTVNTEKISAIERTLKDIKDSQKSLNDKIDTVILQTR